MEADEKTLEWHSAVVLPYHVDNDGSIRFLFERKDPGFAKPYFNSGLNMFGGNWIKSSEYTDKSPGDIITREIREEFYAIDEQEETYTQITGKTDTEPNSTKENDRLSISDRQIVSGLIPLVLDGHKYAGTDITVWNQDFVGKVDPGKRSGSSYFVKELTAEEYGQTKEIVDGFGGKLTTDNLKWGGECLFVSLDELNANKYHFAWDSGDDLRTILRNGSIPPAKEQPIAIRTLDGVTLCPIDEDSVIERDGSGAPTFDSFINDLGFTYVRK
jgi:hypothetical protein